MIIGQQHLMGGIAKTLFIFTQQGMGARLGSEVRKVKVVRKRNGTLGYVNPYCQRANSWIPQTPIRIR